MTYIIWGINQSWLCTKQIRRHLLGVCCTCSLITTFCPLSWLHLCPLSVIPQMPRKPLIHPVCRHYLRDLKSRVSCQPDWKQPRSPSTLTCCQWWTLSRGSRHRMEWAKFCWGVETPELTGPYKWGRGLNTYCYVFQVTGHLNQKPCVPLQIIEWLSHKLEHSIRGIFVFPWDDWGMCCSLRCWT